MRLATRNPGSTHPSPRSDRSHRSPIPADRSPLPPRGRWRPRLLTVLLAALALGSASASRAVAPVIVVVPDASPLERFAAREIRRYTWLRTGEWLGLDETGRVRPDRDAFLVGSRRRPLVEAAWTAARVTGLGGNEPGTHQLFTLQPDDRHRHLLVTGSDDTATLYAAYRWAEHLGVRFYLHGDVLPDERIRLELPDLAEFRRPLFALRGIQPFHDFPEGPDWWNRDDYRAVISQLPKLGMNFFALHTYPEGRPNAEPTVWIGLPGEFDAAGQVGVAYPASYQNTLRGNWGYQAKPTSAFSHGTGALFDRDAFGPEVMRDRCPEPSSPEAARALFDDTARLLADAFSHARRLGVKTCVGTETPLVVPRAVADRLRAAGANPDDPAVRQRLYEGIFARAAAAYPLDYYWFWTPEGWTWEGTKDEQVRATTDDLAAALAAHAAVKAPFRLATCGWVLGPAQDRALFDKVLPKDVALSCINREVGRTPVEPGFRDVQGRGKWAIPWLEDDPALTSLQLWAGRMRRDAADALDYGCDGLMGIHWRTRVLGPAVAALAQAAWSQEGWRDELHRRRRPPVPDRDAGQFVVGGRPAAFPDHAIADTDDDAVYQTVRYDLKSYRLAVPVASCRVVLRFCEPHYRETGKRVFDVVINGRRVIEALDIFARVGADRALDFVFEGIQPVDGHVDVTFPTRVEFPSIAGISLEGAGFAYHLDCGGSGAGRFVADLAEKPIVPEPFAPTDDFYRDWATAEFGPNVATEAAAIFARIDGNLPRPSDWIDGPGGLKPDPRPWLQVRAEYAFVDDLAALRSRVRGPGQAARFDWWLDSFRHLRAMGELGCAYGVFQEALRLSTHAPAAGADARAARERVLGARRDLVRLATEAYRSLLATVSNPGELGTLANWEQHILPEVFGKSDAAVARLAGGVLPAEAVLPATYRGPTRLILPTTPTSVTRGEPLDLPLLVLSERAPQAVHVYVRRLGGGRFARSDAVPRERGVYRIRIASPEDRGDDLEWYVELTEADGRRIRWPATAPETGHTVVVEPAW